MFWFCKPKILNIDFFTTREDIFHSAKPKKAAQFFPKWFKNLPKPFFEEDRNAPLVLKKTIKHCPAFINLYASGFMFPLWSDLNIEVKSETYRYQFADNQSTVNFHSKKQFCGFDFEDSHLQIKLLNPWHMITNRDVNMLWTAPVWNNFGVEDIVIAPGVFSAYKGLYEANINMFVKKNETKIYQLNFGDPLVHIVPLTNMPIKLHYHLVSQKELESRWSKFPIKLMQLDGYRRARKLCSHA